jgi:predicted nucleotidyltransferase component of viral defense system
MNANLHRNYMTQVLLDIFRDKDLSRLLAFKGGTALMMFHGLPRFSTDLDFNLLDNAQAEPVYKALHKILLRYGTIDDEAMKFYGSILVLNYGKGERMMKVEVSNRQYDNHYEIRNLLGVDIRVMTAPDMFAHKLCALGERITPRDIFDVWFFLKNRTEINESIIRMRANKSISDYCKQCAEIVRATSSKTLMQGLGEVLFDNDSKRFVRTKLITETAEALQLFSLYPLIAQQTSQNE